SAKLGIFNADDLEAGVITETQLAVGNGPSGVVLDVPHDRLYVMNRIDHTIRIVTNASNPATRAVGPPVSLRFDPSPPAARNGRIFLYDARRSGRRHRRRRRSPRRGQGVPELHPGVRGSPRGAEPAPDGRDPDLPELHPNRPVPAEPDPRTRQQLHLDAIDGTEHLPQFPDR